MVAPASGVTSDGGPLQIRVDRYGDVFTADWLQAAIAQGKGFAAGAGKQSTHVTFLTYAVNTPDLWVRVPSGITIIPFYGFAALDANTGTAINVVVRTAANDIGNGTSSAADLGPVNLRADVAAAGSAASQCVARQLATVATTAEVAPMELDRVNFAVAQGASSDGYNYRWQPAIRPLLVGPATLELFVSATTAQSAGYCGFSWIELPSTLF
ncbi:MAG: hypothetical protein QOF51_331 [Chloroflexota bacterium]|jgi:hypothetical protein|nr:hypothetical protein [Chloroflexota bacterium]